MRARAFADRCRRMLICALVAIGLTGAARDSAPPAISPAALRTHTSWLADDRTEGRKPGTPGFDLAARYVAAQFARTGLTAPGGRWFQPIDFTERRVLPAPALAVTIAGTRFAAPDAVVGAMMREGKQSWSGGAVFVGHGLVSPADGIDAYAGVDVRGKVVVLLDTPDAALPQALKKALPQDRIKLARDHGAAGVLLLRDAAAEADFSWKDLRGEHGVSTIGWMEADGTPHRAGPVPGFVVSLGPAAAKALLAGAPPGYGDPDSASRQPERSFALPAPVTVEGATEWRRFRSANVVGLLPGADPALANEVVVVIAHLDHLGTDPALPGSDKIYNGALDNASGVAALLETSRTLAAGPRPRRPILFVAATAEEMGLLGSDYLALHPVTGGRVVAVVNLDGGVPIHPLARVTALGGAHSTIGATVARLARARGIATGEDSLDSFFDRTDSYSFARAGVPSVYLVAGAAPDTPALKRYFASAHHQPGDDLSLPFDWDAGAQFVTIARDLVRSLADARSPPLWYADSPFAARYAPDAIKAPAPNRAGQGR